MIREGHNRVSFFTGTEVEHTPAYGLKTLFVVGLQSTECISDHLLGCDHIYFGANMSFPKSADEYHWKPWTEMISYFLELGYLCTLDIDVSCVDTLIDSKLSTSNNFITMISVKLPHIRQLGYNATIKIDDVDFDSTNPGVWCHSLHSLQNQQAFTPWSKYTQDETL